METDLNRGVLYICESLDGMEGVFMFDVGEEPNYQRIEQGLSLIHILKPETAERRWN